MANMLNTREQILDNAKALIQSRGYNGFSFRDIATKIGIKSSSIHYYYPEKTDLVVAVATQYRSDFISLTEELIAKNKKAIKILTAYAEVFESTLKIDNKLCLCGMLASEMNSIEPELHTVIGKFFSDQHKILTSIISKGQSQNEISADINAKDFAKTYFATLEGAMMIARVNKRPSDIKLASKQMLALICR